MSQSTLTPTLERTAPRLAAEPALVPGEVGRIFAGAGGRPHPQRRLRPGRPRGVPRLRGVRNGRRRLPHRCRPGAAQLPQPAAAGRRARADRRKRRRRTGAPLDLRRRPRSGVHCRMAGPHANRGSRLGRGGQRAPFRAAASRCRSASGTVRVLSGEQSNTSVIVDDGDSAAIVKFFRVLSAGRNPEVEVGAALSAARTSEVPATLGWVTGEWFPAGGGYGRMGRCRARPVQGELAVAHEFLAGGRDAWRLAVDAAAGGSGLHAEAHALGHATATVHRRLAETLGVSAEAVPGGDHCARSSPARAAGVDGSGTRRRALRRSDWKACSADSRAPRPVRCSASTATSTSARSSRFPAAKAAGPVGHPRLRGGAAAAHLRAQLSRRPAAGRDGHAALL